ncbi:DM13 domain-containing protein [uncultured Polaribacter sp.]|uniref:DM13 domain-containing protein n=1 Tax=uncultured Polaribacter sp. TaxID=174711 RepID=UPI002638B8E9|nr:DM13 domain-containing protein [uncultured Polaribacter sp.]
MKTLLLITFLSFSFLQLQGQCIENASSFGNNTTVPSYNISGDVSVTLNTNNTATINFASNFETASGPDVRLYLIKSEGKSISQLKSLNPENLENISFGLIGFSGAQSYTASIPQNTDITKFDRVFFYCLRFNQFWDVGTFTSFKSSSCNVLNIDNFAVNNISIYPNPAKNKIHITQLDKVSVEIRIFNLLGKQVLHQPNIKQNSIDISSLNEGIYLVKINIDGKTKSQKLVIQ